MTFDRRTVLRVAALGVAGSLAGCLDDLPLVGANEGDGVTVVDSMPLALRVGRPDWAADEDAVGDVIVVDDADRMQAVASRYDLDDDRLDDLQAFLEDVDYDSERVVRIESVGPNLCYDTVSVDDVRVDGDRLRADATVVDTSGADVGCPEAVGYPSTLLRVAFDSEPVDDVAVDVTDGWGETATVSASTDDPLAPPSDDLPGHVAPEGDGVPIEPLDCDDPGFDRHPQWFTEGDVHLGDFERDDEVVAALRVDGTEHARGDRVEVRLTNLLDEGFHTGNRHKFNLQVLTTSGWQDVRGGEKPFGYPDQAVSHPPGDGFTWSFELTEAGVVEDAMHDLRVCPGLPAGRYRFAYFGVIGEGAVAVEFDLVD